MQVQEVGQIINFLIQNIEYPFLVNIQYLYSSDSERGTVVPLEGRAQLSYLYAADIPACVDRVAGQAPSGCDLRSHDDLPNAAATQTPPPLLAMTTSIWLSPLQGKARKENKDESNCFDDMYLVVSSTRKNKEG